MAKKTLKIADKPTLDEVNENVKALTNSKNMILQNIILGNPTDENGIIQADSSYSSLPYALHNGCEAICYNNKIHIFGGAGGKENHYSLSGAWSKASTLPLYGFTHGSIVVYGGCIHIVGSEIGGSYRMHYKWDGTSWTQVSTLPYDFCNGSAVVCNNEIHILGGSNSSYRTNHYKWDGSSWTEVSTLPYNFYNGSAVVYNNAIHILGGNGKNTAHYKWDGTSWTSASSLPYIFYNGSAVVCNNEIHILGSGDTVRGLARKHYKWNGSSWTEVSIFPYIFYNGSAVVYNNKIHILGGTNGQQNHYTIIAECYRAYENLYLFKNQKIYSGHKMIPIKNCTSYDDYLLVTEDGPVSFKIESATDNAVLTIV